eukprot:1937507-Pleurochrysis_carterae.AAC.1
MIAGLHPMTQWKWFQLLLTLLTWKLLYCRRNCNHHTAVQAQAQVISECVCRRPQGNDSCERQPKTNESCENEKQRAFPTMDLQRCAVQNICRQPGSVWQPESASEDEGGSRASWAREQEK